MQARYLYSELASAIQARKNCVHSGNEVWKHRHEDWIEHLVKNCLPSGSGIDCGTSIDLDASHGEKLVLGTSFHHMNDGGYYDGWTEHVITVTPSFSGGFHLRISGRNRNDIKEYLHEEYSCALAQDVRFEWWQYHFDGVPTWQWNQDRQTGETSYTVLGVDQAVLASFPDLGMVRQYIVAWCEENRQTLKAREL